jgi:hypothetical protein
MEWFFFWLLFSIVVGIIAANRGRSGFGWFVLSMVISPLLGVILVALIPAIGDERPSTATHVKCPDCAELVLKEARKCKHCGCHLVPASEQPKERETVSYTPPKQTG